MRFDVIILGDLRFPGGTSTAIASEVEALDRAGYSVGLIPVAGSVLKYPHPVNKSIRSLLERGTAQLVPRGEKIEAGLCLLSHPQVFDTYPSGPWKISAQHTRLIVHHPPVDGAGLPFYDWRAIDRVTRDLFGDVAWSPVGPQAREAFRGLSEGPVLSGEDWLNTIDPGPWKFSREGFVSARPVIGRHSRDGWQKWPADRETFLQAYPDRSDIQVRLMGYGAAQDEIVDRRPKNWTVLPFDAMDVRRFLGTLDFFVYYHHPDWIEAFGRTILEAAASGAVPVLPGGFRPLFGDAAVYCEPAEVAETVLALHGDRAAFDRQSRAGTEVIEERFGPDVAVERVKRHIGAPGRAQSPAIATGRRTKALFFTSNGIGMGHLTRALAVARRLPETVEPVLVSLSKAFGVAARDGIASDYIPYHKSVGMNYELWQESLEKEISALLKYHQPGAFIFDGNVPYPGMMAALIGQRHVWRVWERRGMWAPGAGENHIKQEPLFDAVIEPGELAQELDRGLTREHRDRTVAVAPVRYLREGEALTREEARRQIGIDEDSMAVLLQLGSENNFDLSSVRALVCERLGRESGITIVNAEWLIRDASTPLPEGVIGLREYPIARFLSAFDFAIGTGGYNTFHENIFAGLPTLFVANENPEQDEQWLRAHYAELRGMALAGRFSDPYSILDALERMLDPDVRAELRQGCQRLDPENGADDAALYLSHLVETRR